MSVQGPSASPFRAFAPIAATRPAPPATGLAPAAPAAAPAAAAPASPPAPPAASLWGLLTEDERAFFAQQALLGTLTYGRTASAAPAPTPGAPLGQRIDVRG